MGGVTSPGTISKRSPLADFSPESLFVLSAISQYLGAAIAINLFRDLRPASVAWIRVAAAAVIIVVVSRRDHRRWTKPALIGVAVFGVSTALMNMFFYLGISHLGLGKSVAIEFIGPITVAALRTRTARNVVALLLATFGVIVLAGFGIKGQTIGLLFIFAASAMWALYIVFGARVARDDRGLSGLGIGLAIGALVITPFGVVHSGPAWHSPRILGLCALVGLLSNAVPYGIDQNVMRRISTRRFAVLLALLPVTAVVTGAIALNQIPTGLDIVGVAFVLAGVIAQEREGVTSLPAD
jgi:inner membrane transporter RhtA